MASFVAIRPAALGCKPSSVWAKTITSYAGSIRPHRAPVWLDASVELPLTLVVREVTFQVTQPGFRTQSVTLVTTLLDAKSYPAWALAELYLRRWRMELWLRDIKITMDMDMLRTKTPARVRAELAMFLVGYNLIRTVMFDASKVSEVRLEQLSFKSALMRFGLWCAGLRRSTRISGVAAGIPGDVERSGPRSQSGSSGAI